MNNDLLRKLPSVSDLLASPQAQAWLDEHPRPLVTECLRQAVDQLRRSILDDSSTGVPPVPAGATGETPVLHVLQLARAELAERTRPHLRPAINATGIILHTGLGRSVLPECAVDSLHEDLQGYVTLAVDRDSGQRSERDQRVEYILTELTGAEAATVVNNNAAATLLVLAALAEEKEVIVSRGQLIEIGGSFRLPDVMRQGGCRLVEVGTTNRTHLKDYQAAITDRTAAILRVHPSNYRVVGFTAQPELSELVELAHGRGIILLDDLGSGALVDLAAFGLPHEPTAGESISAGADAVLFSADKLIGSAQGGVIVGKKACIERVRRHPLARALRVDKTCLMALERTLVLFRDPSRLPERHPLYRMLATPVDALRQRADRLRKEIAAALPAGALGFDTETQRSEKLFVLSASLCRTPAPPCEVVQSEAYLGSGSLPMHALASFAVRLTLPNLKPQELARRLRLDESAVFARIENDAVLLDVRTLTDGQIAPVAAAVGRAAESAAEAQRTPRGEEAENSC